jgi:cellulose synthase/poly-beta-1,6-N-acetylglucosamine synthase-like glycosyltransferase
VVTEHFSHHPQVLILAQENSGKSVALNNGIHASRSDIVICMDADTIVRPDVINKFIPHFYDERVAAVAGNIRVGNRKNLLTLVQHVEYNIISNFERIVLDRINCITSVPGALGAFRRSVLVALGGYETGIMIEDADLCLKLQSKNFLIRNAPEAIACTEVPLGLKMYLRQRVRWKTGALQVLWKYRRRFLSHPNKTLTYLVIPFRWVFNIFISVIAPFADYYFFYDLLFLHTYASVPYYLSFVLIDALICIVILMRWKEPFSTMLFVIPQRFITRQLTFVYHLLILYKFLKGSLFRWDKIVRYGNIKLD